MSKQNIFDDPVFFSGYEKLRENPNCANNVEEKPALFSLIGDLRGKRVLDLGCGAGENCPAFLDLGASAVTGIDLSARMLAVAAEKHTDPRITYHRLPMEDLSQLPGSFDAVISSLAIHYVEDFPALCRAVYEKLTPGGIFVFSQEHPLTTALTEDAMWAYNPDGTVSHYRLTSYCLPGVREISWFVDGIIKYHRTFSDLVNALTASGFVIETMAETAPSPELIARIPSYEKHVHKPNFLLLRAKKAPLAG